MQLLTSVKQQDFDNINYLNDLGMAETADKADEAFSCLGKILSMIGIKELVKKAVPPTFIVVFLGILFNTLTMTLQIISD